MNVFIEDIKAEACSAISSFLGAFGLSEDEYLN
jgi:hypothetical protein